MSFYLEGLLYLWGKITPIVDDLAVTSGSAQVIVELQAYALLYLLCRTPIALHGSLYA